MIGPCRLETAWTPHGSPMVSAWNEDKRLLLYMYYCTISVEGTLEKSCSYSASVNVTGLTNSQDIHSPHTVSIKSTGCAKASIAKQA